MSPQVVDVADPGVDQQEAANPPAASCTPLLRSCLGCGRPIAKPDRWCSEPCRRADEGPLDRDARDAR